MIDHLPYLVPFTREEWEASDVGTVVMSARFMDFHQKCIADIHQSGRTRRYTELFTMITHIERFPEFDRKSYGKFLKEAGNQPLTRQRLQKTMSTILAVSGPNEVLPNAATAFEFLHFAGEFGRFTAERIGAVEQLRESVEAAAALSVMAFLLAVNVELGILSPNSWKLGV